MAQKFSAAEVCTTAEKLFLAELPQTADKFVVKFFKNGALHIAVVNSSIAAELRLAESVIRAALAKRGTQIQSFRYSIGLPEKVLPF